MKYYIITGEASGDLHASNLVKEMKNIFPGCSFRAWGGDLLAASGAEVVRHIRDLAFMGFAEVIMNLRTIFKNIEFCKKDILEWKPDAVILVDYPGFNLRIAKFLKEKGIPVYYYISPQVWAWKSSRVNTIKRTVDKMITILPFEKDFYRSFGMEVEYVGHPLLDALGEEMQDRGSSQSNPRSGIIALLPGSRKQEIEAKLPLMTALTRRFPEYEFRIAGAPSISPEFYAKFTNGKIPVVHGKTYALLQESEAALVTSGTATLETALLGIPEVVCYKGNPLSFAIAKRIVNVKYISLVNLIMNEEVVKELIQQELTVDNLERELRRVLDRSHREWLFGKYRELRKVLGGTGASRRAAELILGK